MSDHKQKLVKMHAELNQILGSARASNIYLGDTRVAQFNADKIMPMIQEWIDTVQVLTIREMSEAPKEGDDDGRQEALGAVVQAAPKLP